MAKVRYSCSVILIPDFRFQIQFLEFEIWNLKSHFAVYSFKIQTMSFKGKTVFITGASRGIGLAIGKRLAQEGANIVIAAKTVEVHPKLPGTIYSAAEEIEAAGGKALPVICDIRFEEQVQEAVNQAVTTFGGIDILINNASAISLTGTLQTDMKHYDLKIGRASCRERV